MATLKLKPYSVLLTHEVKQSFAVVVQAKTRRGAQNVAMEALLASSLGTFEETAIAKLVKRDILGDSSTADVAEEITAEAPKKARAK